ncbi:hypothetical protein [Bacillus swezeyi]|uniref:Lipoprotein n=1 Tax=Bacillus swezeyi TaxID=1925020 RepID=A0A5M8RHK6_9BACI|nr:hypothetical protein [Bacillus swezeyi]KAA6446918.1 hypothetical protein DX927_22975 [Bacillus swezeyi]KAA6471486.1 hypothetical protein DX928_23215 [Bacillus swezeyi]
MKKVMLWGLSLSLAGVLTACGGNDDPKQEKENPTGTANEKQSEEKGGKKEQKAEKKEAKDDKTKDQEKSDNEESEKKKESSTVKHDSSKRTTSKSSNKSKKSSVSTSNGSGKTVSSKAKTQTQNKKISGNKVAKKSNSQSKNTSSQSQKSNKKKTTRHAAAKSKHTASTKKESAKKEQTKSTDPNVVKAPSRSGNFTAMKAKFSGKYDYTTGTHYKGFSHFSKETSRLSSGNISVSQFKDNALDYQWNQDGKEYSAWSADAIKFETSSLNVQEILGEINAHGGNFGGMITDIQFYYNAATKKTSVALTGVQLKYE